VSELKNDLASLRLNEAPEKSRKGLWIFLGIILLAAGAGVYAWRSTGGFSKVEVATVTPTVEQVGSAAAGTPVLTASGYLVARREAVVSSKIQGRLLDLRVEEGSEVKTGEILAKLESADYEAQLARARAQLQQAEAAIGSSDAAIHRAEADLAEAERQLSVNTRLNADKLVPVDTLDASRSRVRMAEAALAQSKADRDRSAAASVQSQADVTFAEAQLNNTIIRAPFAGTVVKKMAEVGESVAPIPPGVNISTASGAIVALADLATLEMEGRRLRGQRRQAGERPARRGVGRGVPGSALQGHPAADHPDRGPDEGHRADEGDADREGQGPQARDEREGHVPRAAEARGRDDGGHGARQAEHLGAAGCNRHARRRPEGVRSSRGQGRSANDLGGPYPQRSSGCHGRPRRIGAAGVEAAGHAQGRRQDHCEEVTEVPSWK
jgi:multidrug efflux pump subunit AcrA (membrane-fusion protein)